MTFQNPMNGYTEPGAGVGSFIAALLFGPLYLACKGLWGHAFLALILAAPTFGLSWLIYSIVAPSLVNNWYRRHGWKQVRGGDWSAWSIQKRVRPTPAHLRPAQPIAPAPVGNDAGGSFAKLPTAVQVFVARSNVEWDCDRLWSLWTLGTFADGADMVTTLAAAEKQNGGG